MKKQTAIILTMVGCTALTACATSTETAQKEKGIAAFADDVRLGEPVKKICFNSNIDGFSNNRRDTVVLSTGPSKDYIVEVSGICPKLNYAQSIAIDSMLSCVTRGDYLIVSESAFSLDDNAGFGPDRCRINAIRKWDARAEKSEDESVKSED